MSISYAPGTAFALVRPGVVVLLDDAVEPSAVTAIWAALERLGRPDGMADVLDTVTTVLDPTLRELPDFGVVVHESDVDGSESGVLHVVARGRVSVHLAGEVGSETIEAFDMTTWADKRFTDVDSYELAAGKTGVAADLSLALTTGVVTARSITWQRPHEPEAGDAASTEPAETEPAETGLAGAEPAGTEPAETEPAKISQQVAPVEPAETVEPVEPDPTMVPVDPAEPDFARTLGEFPDGTLGATDQDAADDAVTAAAEEAADDHAAADDTADDEVPVAMPVVERPEPGTPDEDLDDTVFSLEGVRGLLGTGRRESTTGDGSGAQVSLDKAAPGPQPAAAPAPTRAPSAPAPEPSRSALPPVPPPPPEPAPYPAGAPVPAAAPYPAFAPPSPSAQPALPGAPESGHAPYPVYQAAPQMPPGEAFAAVAGQAGQPGQADEVGPPVAAPAPEQRQQQWSVQLPGTPAPLVEPAAPAVVSDAPTILARSCAYGHANTPVRSTCAVCGGGLNPQAEVVPRPSLGRVLVSTGEVVELEQPVVFGRYPQAHVVTAQAQAPRLVTVPSPSQDISRSHLEVRLEGWNVLLVDLTTVNGTTLLRPGQPPRRLHPQEPTLVMSGDVADLGDGVRLTFEGLA